MEHENRARDAQQITPAQQPPVIGPQSAISVADHAPAATTRPSLLGAANTLAMQRTVGNRAVQRLIKNQPSTSTVNATSLPPVLQRKIHKMDHNAGNARSLDVAAASAEV